MTTLDLAPPTTPARPDVPAPAAARPLGPPRGGPSRLLAVVTGRERASEVLDEAHRTARETGLEVHTALLLPRVPVPRVPVALDAALVARLVEEADREETELVTLVVQRAAAAGVPVRIGVHRLSGLHGPRRERVLDRTVARLARRLDAVPLGWPAP
ncbi:hypothetical protein ACI798_04470 [Geodermatophilus sp. SYSU D01045]